MRSLVTQHLLVSIGMFIDVRLSHSFGGTLWYSKAFAPEDVAVAAIHVHVKAWLVIVWGFYQPSKTDSLMHSIPIHQPSPAIKELHQVPDSASWSRCEFDVTDPLDP